MVKINPKLLLEAIYPVGSIFINTTGTNPSTFLGGTWEEFGKGRVLVGKDTTQTEFDTLGETGGSKYLQEHNHMGRTYSKNYNAGQTIPGGRAYARSYVPSDDTSGVWKYSGSGAVSGAEITSMIETGNSGTGNSGNLQPYVVVSMWQRTA